MVCSLLCQLDQLKMLLHKQSVIWYEAFLQYFLQNLCQKIILKLTFIFQNGMVNHQVPWECLLTNFPVLHVQVWLKRVKKVNFALKFCGLFPVGLGATVSNDLGGRWFKWNCCKKYYSCSIWGSCKCSFTSSLIFEWVNWKFWAHLHVIFVTDALKNGHAWFGIFQTSMLLRYIELN